MSRPGLSVVEQRPQAGGALSEGPRPGSVLHACSDADLPTQAGLRGPLRTEAPGGLGGDQSEPLAPGSGTAGFGFDPGPCPPGTLCTQRKEESGEAP